jgi:HlyD family secretion protein
MMAPAWKKTLYAAAGLALTGVLVWILLPDPLLVETSRVNAGPLQVTVEEDGETRAHDRFVLSAPVSGRVARIELREGDAVARDQIVAEIWPLPLSAREREEQLARIGSAEALAREAGERVRRAQAEYDQAGREHLRDRLVASGFVLQTPSRQVDEKTKAN